MKTKITDAMFPVREVPAIENYSKHGLETGYKFIVREDTN